MTVNTQTLATYGKKISQKILLKLLSGQTNDLFLVRNLLVPHSGPGAAADRREEHVAGEGLLDPCHVQPA
jgi:hypothetical protein